MTAIAAAKAKANFLGLLKEIEAKRESFTVTRNGRPVARLVPLEAEEDPLAIFHYPGLSIVGDVVSPAFEAEDWEERT